MGVPCVAKIFSLFSRDLTIPHLEPCISPSALWVASDIWLVPFNSRIPLVTECIIKNSKKLNFLTVYHFCFSQYFLDVQPRVMQAVIANIFLVKMPVQSQFTERKETG